MKILLVALLLLGCSRSETKLTQHTIKQVLNCTNGYSDYFDDRPAKCRVIFIDGERATLYAPVAEGDTVECRHNEIYRRVKHCYLK